MLQRKRELPGAPELKVTETVHGPVHWLLAPLRGNWMSWATPASALSIVTVTVVFAGTVIVRGLNARSDAVTVREAEPPPEGGAGGGFDGAGAELPPAGAAGRGVGGTAVGGGGGSGVAVGSGTGVSVGGTSVGVAVGALVAVAGGTVAVAAASSFASPPHAAMRTTRTGSARSESRESRTSNE